MAALRLLKLYAIAFAVLFVVDLVWLGVIARGVYVEHLGHLMREQTLWGPAIAFYVCFVAGVVFFVVVPAVDVKSAKAGAGRGAFFGFVTYQTYELTNWALLRDWPWRIVVIDIGWGIVLGAVVGGVSVAAALALDRRSAPVA